MDSYSPSELAAKLGSGLLSFPVTTFNAEDLTFDAIRYQEHLEWLSSYPVAGLFAAGGTGEFFSLTNNEIRNVIRTAVSGSAGRVPVLAPVGGSVAQAIELARIAEEENADGLLLFPPYLTEASQEGLVEYAVAIAKSTKLGIIVYSRANGIVAAKSMARIVDRAPNVVGFKDGIGRIDLAAEMYATLGDRLVYIGGVPTAETYALPYLELGFTTYSSAMFNFVPEFALDFYNDVVNRDRDAVNKKLRDFVLPYLEIRDRNVGYAVSIVKAGLNAVGRPAGPVRAPLTMLQPDEQLSLNELVAKLAIHNVEQPALA